MKHDFLCGGDYGAWETEVTVELTGEEENLMMKFASNRMNEHLDWFPPMDKIHAKIMRELRKESVGKIDKKSVVIWIPGEFRKDNL